MSYASASGILERHCEDRGVQWWLAWVADRILPQTFRRRRLSKKSLSYASESTPGYESAMAWSKSAKSAQSVCEWYLPDWR